MFFFLLENHWKQLAECLVLSRIGYNDVLFHQVLNYLINQPQPVQLAAASFVTGKYADLSDILNLGWLPVKHNMNWNLWKLAYKVLNCEKWPLYLSLEVCVHQQTLWSSSVLNLVIPQVSGTFQDCAVKVFDKLPKNV